MRRGRITPERAHAVRLVAEVDGAVVAFGEGGLIWRAANPTAGFADVVVDPAHRGRGFGAALYERLEAHAREIGAETISTTFFENEDGRAFAARRGFREERVAVASAVDPRTVTLAPAAGVELVAMSGLDPRSIYEADEAAAADEPSADPFAESPYDEWLDHTWKHPSFVPEGSFAAVVDGRPVSVAFLFVAPGTGRAVNAFTGTVPAHRGRGLALAAKVATLRWAAANGVTRVTTGNDDENAPMLAINRKLGYEPLGRVLTMRREL